MDKKRLLIGLAFNAETWIVNVINVLCIYCIFKGKLYNSKENPAYLITIFNILTDIFQNLLHSFYVAPVILLGNAYYPGQRAFLPTLGGSWLTFFWLLACFIQVMMAANRLCVVLLPKNNIFTRKMIFISFSIIILLTLGILYVLQHSSLCCPIVPDPNAYGYAAVFENDVPEPTVTLNFIQYPLNAVASGLCLISYIVMFTSVYRLKRTVHTNISTKEIWLCVQFFVVFALFTVTWVYFTSISLIGLSDITFNIITLFFLIANCGSNSMVYLLMNKDIHRELKILRAHLTGKKYADIFSVSTQTGNKTTSGAQPNISVQ